MTKTQLEELHKLSKKDKIKLVQTLWDDIANDHDYTDLPIDHKKILEERLDAINNGKAIFRPWYEVRLM